MAKARKKVRSKSMSKQLPAEVIGALADKFGKSFKTITRWLDAGDDRMISDKARSVFQSKNIKWPSEAAQN